MSRAILAAVTLAWLAATPASAQPADSPEERRAAATALVEATGGQRQVVATLQAMRNVLVTQIRQLAGGRVTEPQIAAIVDEVLMPEFEARSGDITANAATIWARHLTAAELRELIAFYGTPVGRRLTAILPEVAAESAQFGQRWGQQVANDAVTRHRETLRARGLPF